MATNTEIIVNFAQFKQAIANLSDGEFVYRGQSDKDWIVKSGAYRRASKNGTRKPLTNELIEYNKGLLNDAKNYERVSGGKKDLELLADLQHQGGATSLIDFSHSPLIALWFACQDGEKDGKVFCLNTADVNTFLVITSEDKEESIEKILRLDLRDNKKIQTAKWQPSLINNRIIKQDSVFIFNQSGKIEDTDFNKVLIISKKHKVAILKGLEKLTAINETRIFPDFYGFAQSNAANKPYEAETAEDVFKRALDHHLAGRLEEAIKDYNRATELDPDYVEVYNNRGIAKADLKQPEEALKDYNRAIELDPNYATAYANRGVVKGNLKQPEEAIKDYNRAIELDPDDSKAYNNRGNAKGNLKQPEEAIKDYNRAIELDPDDATAYANRGIVNAGLENFEEAIKDYNRAIELDLNFAVAYNNRGAVKVSLKQIEEAIKDYEQARDIYNKQGNIDQAKRCQELIAALKKPMTKLNEEDIEKFV